MQKAVDIKSVNDIYPIIGDGIYQARAICVVCLAMMPLAMPQYLMVFLSQTPQWTSNNTNNISSSLDDICKLNGSQWKFITPTGYSIVPEVRHFLIEIFNLFDSISGQCYHLFWGFPLFS